MFQLLASASFTIKSSYLALISWITIINEYFPWKRHFNQLLGGECYHYHSKVVIKDPLAGGERAWHQDYGYEINVELAMVRL